MADPVLSQKIQYSDAPQWARLLDRGPCVKAVFMQYLLGSLWYSMWSIYLTFQPVTLVVTSPLNQAVVLSSIPISMDTHSRLTK